VCERERERGGGRERERENKDITIHILHVLASVHVHVCVHVALGVSLMGINVMFGLRVMISEVGKHHLDSTTCTERFTNEATNPPSSA
jgi:hypothetical protein